MPRTLTPCCSASLEKDYYCAGYKMYFEHVLRRVHADLLTAVAAAPAD